MNRNQRAAQQFSTWRSQGVPTLITAHEAHRLTAGAVGTHGDHSTPVNLSTAALRGTK